MSRNDQFALDQPPHVQIAEMMILPGIAIEPVPIAIGGSDSCRIIATKATDNGQTR